MYEIVKYTYKLRTSNEFAIDLHALAWCVSCYPDPLAQYYILTILMVGLENSYDMQSIATTLLTHQRIFKYYKRKGIL